MRKPKHGRLRREQALWGTEGRHPVLKSTAFPLPLCPRLFVILQKKYIAAKLVDINPKHDGVFSNLASGKFAAYVRQQRPHALWGCLLLLHTPTRPAPLSPPQFCAPRVGRTSAPRGRGILGAGRAARIHPQLLRGGGSKKEKDLQLAPVGAGQSTRALRRCPRAWPVCSSWHRGEKKPCLCTLHRKHAARRAVLRT